jgi:hypothetical protein
VRALTGKSGDLYAASEAVALAQDDLLALVEDMTLASVPPAMEGLRGLALDAARQYADAAQRVAGVLSAPGLARQNDAANAVQVARNYLLALEDSAWLKAR